MRAFLESSKTSTATRPSVARTSVSLSAWSVALVGIVLVASACQRSTECERQRLSVFRAWESVHKAAYERKLAGVDEPQWTAIEAKTDLLQSAFATRQVTWDSAKKATKDIQTLAEGAKTDTELKLEVFKTSAAEAAAKQAQFYDNCH